MKPNRLIKETSLYLLQHAYNPVNWQPYDNEALNEAKLTNRPLFISIGYSSCHWCHVMERESFNNEDIATLLNKYFVCVKIDREERPDIDNIYMASVRLLHNTGGWPLNCFTLPDGSLFWGGTYFRPQQWKELIEQINNLYTNNFQELKNQAERIKKGVVEYNNFIYTSKPENDINIDFIYHVSNIISNRFDVEKGGLIGSPKFPLPPVLEFVLAAYLVNGDSNLLLHVEKTLTNMANGGIFDQLAGGFSRYSVDTKWKIPHFEKMLYDNAQLVSTYSNVYLLTKNDYYKKVLISTLSFVLKVFLSEDNTFYTALDADSEGDEGKYYVWTKEEINKILGNYSVLLCKFWSIEKDGYWENGKNILIRPNNIKLFASQNGLSETELLELVKTASTKLLVEREKRKPPLLDKKVVTSNNALMIKAFIDAYKATQIIEYKDIAIKTALFFYNKIKHDSANLKRVYSNESNNISGFLDDYSFLAEAFVSLYQITFDEKWLFKAKQLVEKVINTFLDSEKLFFHFTSINQNSAPNLRLVECEDNVQPSGNATMCYLLKVLGFYFDNSAWIQHSEKMLMQLYTNIQSNPAFYSKWAFNAAILAKGITFYAVTGKNAIEKALEMQLNYSPFTFYAASDNNSKIPLLKNKFKKGKTLLYKCNINACDNLVEL